MHIRNASLPSTLLELESLRSNGAYLKWKRHLKIDICGKEVAAREKVRLGLRLSAVLDFLNFKDCISNCKVEFKIFFWLFQMRVKWINSKKITSIMSSAKLTYLNWVTWNQKQTNKQSNVSKKKKQKQ